MIYTYSSTKFTKLFDEQSRYFILGRMGLLTATTEQGPIFNSDKLYDKIMNISVFCKRLDTAQANDNNIHKLVVSPSGDYLGNTL